MLTKFGFGVLGECREVDAAMHVVRYSEYMQRYTYVQS